MNITINQKLALAHSAGLGDNPKSLDLYRIVTEGDNCEFRYEVTHKVEPVPGVFDQLPEDCYPDDPGEIEFDLFILDLAVDEKQLPEDLFTWFYEAIYNEVFGD